MRDTFPSGMENYLGLYGWHISKRLCDWACRKMQKSDTSGRKVEFVPWDQDKVHDLLKRYGIDCSAFIGYDPTYVCNMARSDFYGSTINDEQHLALFVRDYLVDTDGYDEVAMTRLYADCIGKGEMIPWEDVI